MALRLCCSGRWSWLFSIRWKSLRGARSRTELSVHPDTMGWVVFGVCGCLGGDSRLMVDGSLGLADLAMMILKALIRADKQSTEDVVALLGDLEDVDRLADTVFLDMPGYDCVCTDEFKLG